ncbi:MAG: zinc ABC transporter substrate-binding protein [Treponema sp.]|jgi:zinc transport system substrate-binding protein|nr:zinc ABC transporter substrate-binding protein [Treponema sp.]
MKRFLLTGLTLSLSVCALFAAGNKDAAKNNGKPTVVATNFPPYDFVRAIAGDKVNLSMLLPPGAESHSFEPTPRDIITIQNSDVFIYTGGETDVWVDRILESMDVSKMKIIRMMDVVDVVEEEIVEGMEDDEHDHDHGHAEEDFTVADIKDRALSDWAGDWQSVYPYLLDGTLNPVMEHKAEHGEKTEREYFEQYKTAYATDMDRVVITNDSMTFYRNGVPSTAKYVYKGTGVTPEDDGTLWVRYKFEATGNLPGGAPKYIMFSDHLHAPAKSEHFHIYSSNISFDALMEDTDPVNYPTYYPSTLTKDGIVAEMIGHDHGEEVAYDEHVWTSPKNALRITQAITNALCEIDGADAATFRQNAQNYSAQLNALDKEFQAVVDSAKRKTIVFGDRFPFRYFADAYGLKYFAAFPGCSTETEPSAATVAFLIDKIRAERIPVVFHIELSNEKMADTIAEETGAKKLLLHACHNISKRDFDRGLTFLEIQKANVPRLKEALQ